MVGRSHFGVGSLQSTSLSQFLFIWPVAELKLNTYLISLNVSPLAFCLFFWKEKKANLLVLSF